MRVSHSVILNSTHVPWTQNAFQTAVEGRSMRTSGRWAAGWPRLLAPVHSTLLPVNKSKTDKSLLLGRSIWWTQSRNALLALILTPPPHSHNIVALFFITTPSPPPQQLLSLPLWKGKTLLPFTMKKNYKQHKNHSNYSFHSWFLVSIVGLW